MNAYLSKFGFRPPSIGDPPQKDLGLTVVIPCFNEPDIISSIASLAAAKSPEQGVEIIVVINHGEQQTEAVKRQNNASMFALEKWLIEYDPFFKLHIIKAFDLPKKHAGVGLARKIGMDEAVSRFEVLKKDGIIVCFDADSSCSDDYFEEIEKHFQKHPKTPGAAIRFEHPVEGHLFEEVIYKGIINYELFLRYYNQGLKLANLPFAYHTVGSSMAVRASAYQKQGGMNKRKAGEDFYFLHKIIALGDFTEINTAVVIPSPRTSDRVPFGTGKAISDWVQNDTDHYLTYDYRIWERLRAFSDIIPSLEKQNLSDTVFFKSSDNKAFIRFLEHHNFETSLTEIRANASNSPAFLKRFYTWFNAFRVLKLVHFLRDEQFPNQPIFKQAEAMAKQRGFLGNESTVKALLIAFRRFEAGSSQ